MKSSMIGVANLQLTQYLTWWQHDPGSQNPVCKFRTESTCISILRFNVLQKIVNNFDVNYFHKDISISFLSVGF